MEDEGEGIGVGSIVDPETKECNYNKSLVSNQTPMTGVCREDDVLTDR